MQLVKKEIQLYGRTYELRKDATDPTQSFPMELVTVLNAGCTKVQDNGYCCWIRGVIPPREGTIEVPMEVVALGFSPVEINPKFYTLNVLRGMHFYVANDNTFMSDFAGKFLDLQTAGTNDVALSPFPVGASKGDTDGKQSTESSE